MRLLGIQQWLLKKLNEEKQIALDGFHAAYA
jgi:hypothetical protein